MCSPKQLKLQTTKTKNCSLLANLFLRGHSKSSTFFKSMKNVCKGNGYRSVYAFKNVDVHLVWLTSLSKLSLVSSGVQLVQCKEMGFKTCTPWFELS